MAIQTQTPSKKKAKDGKGQGSSNNNNTNNNTNSSKSKSRSNSNHRQHSHPISPTGQPRSPSSAPSGISGIHQAKILVQSILNQVAFNDSPPVDDIFTNDNGSGSGLGSRSGPASGGNMNANGNAIGNGSSPRTSSSSFSPKKNKIRSPRRKQKDGSSGYSVGNSTIASQSHSHSLSQGTSSYASLAASSASGHGSRQHHIQASVLPTIYSPPPADRSHINNIGGTKQKHGARAHSQMQGPEFVEPSPTAAELGDAAPFLFSPSFANSHISRSQSDQEDSKWNANANTSTHPHPPLPPSSSYSTDNDNESFQSNSNSNTKLSNGLPKSVSIETPRNNHNAPLPMPPPIDRPKLNSPLSGTGIGMSISIGQGPEVVMGNISLAALCARTIESIDVSILDQVMNRGQRQTGNGIVNENLNPNVMKKELGRMDSKEELSQWQKEVEMAPTFGSEENNTHASGSGSGQGDANRKAFLSTLDGQRQGQGQGQSDSSGTDGYLFPNAKSMSLDDSDINREFLDDSMNPIMEEDEDDTGDGAYLDLLPSKSIDDGVVLTSVAEGNEEEEMNVTMPTSNISSYTGRNSSGNGNGNGSDNLRVTTNVNTNNIYAPSPRHLDVGEIPMATSLEFSSTGASPRSPSSALSPDSAGTGHHTKLTMSPDLPPSGATSIPSRPRMQMFGSEYARHLSSESPFSPQPQKSKSRSFAKMRRKKKAPSSANSVAAASIMSKDTVGSPDKSTITDHVSGSMTVMSGMAASHSYGGRVQVGDSAQKNGSVSTLSNTSSIQSGSRIINLEDTPADILSAAITDVVVTHGMEKPPKGYYRISQTSNGTPLDTLKLANSGGIGKRKLSGAFLNVKKEQKWDRAVQRPCVTALTLIFPDRNEFVPPGFCVVRRYMAADRSGKKGGKADAKDAKSNDDEMGTSSSSFPANLNYGTSGERVYLCYRRSREGNPITGMIPLQPSNNESVPEGYTVLERSPRNFVADINSKAGPPLFLAFRQRLANLETLRPLPLVLSVHYANSDHSTTPASRKGRKKRMRLKAYYCTGGTVVPSEVGKYHIMDRSTHPLISPSSVTNRLSLIQASRNKNSSNISTSGGSTAGKKSRPDRSPSPMTLANELAHDAPSLQYSNSYKSEDKSVGAVESDSSVHSEVEPQNQGLVDNLLQLVHNISPLNRNKSSEEDKTKSLLVGDMESESSKAEASTIENDEGHSVASSGKNSFFSTRDDSNMEACFSAMSFIPLIQCPVNSPGKIDRASLEALLEARIAVLTPILTACYTHHGGSSLLAIEGLTKLLNDTDFFMPDLAFCDDANTYQRLTLLDLSIQVVCDVANSTARETNFLPCIEFVVEATNYANGNLNSRTIGYIIRFYLFIFYFGASVPTISSWPKNKTSGYSRKEGLDEANDTLLLSEDELDHKGKRRHRGYVPGGAPQAAALAMKELITIFLSRLRKMSKGGRKEVTNRSGGKTSVIDGFIKDYVESLIDGAVHQVDVSNYTQLALHQIHRSGGSELFWHDMLTSCGLGLFGQDSTIQAAAKDFYVTSFAILSSVVKISSGKVRRLAQSTEFVPRDIASKLLSLELLHHFLHQWGKTCKFNHSLETQASKEGSKIEDSTSAATMAYTIRRLIIPCLLSNTRSGLDDIKVFRRMMKIVTELWCNRLIRRHLKIEIGVLIEHFVLKFLRLGPQVLPPKRLSKTTSSTLNDMSVSLLPQQVCIVTEMKTWFVSEPRDILELFMNFDQVDAQSSKAFSLLPSTHWKITEQLCGALCTLAEQCTDIVSDQIRLTRIDLSEVDSPSAGANPALHHTEEDLKEMTLVREGARYLQGKCFDTIAQIVRSLMLCAAASSGANYNLLSRLREKQEKDIARKQAAENALKKASTMEDDDSSRDSDGNMTVKSVSTIGNIVGGIMNKKKETMLSEGIRIPESPRQPRQVPELTLGEDDGDGIVEYWQTSIAAERRKNTQPSPREGQDANANAQKKPPRGLRASNRFAPSTPPRLGASSNFRGASPLTMKSPRRDDASIVSFADESIRGDPHLSQKFEETLNTAFEIMQTKSLKKALDFLIACNILTPNPRDIASFLRLYQSNIDTSVLGDFLGEGGKDGDEVEHYNLIRFHYTLAISFVGLNVEQGLRHFLTNCGFRLPGEAQKIDRIMTTFSQCFWEDNAGDHSRCPFQDQDTVFLISFAIIMLNTDLHKQSTFATTGPSDKKQKQRKKMTKPEFMNNLRGVNNSEDISREYLSQIYDSIAQNPIAIYRPPQNSSFLDGALAKKTIKFSSGEFGHIIQGNIDLAGMIKHVIKSVKPCQELLRGLAAHEHPYLTIKNSRTNNKKSRKHLVPEELVRSAFCSLWYHFHGTINTALDAAHLDPKGLENCLDVLMYTLCTTICLDLTVERNAFTSQLVRVKFFRENRGLEEDDDMNTARPASRIRDHLDYKNDPWYMRIEKAAESYHENAKIAALDEVDGMFKKLHASLKVDSTLKKEMIKVARRIRNGQILLNDPTRYFLKEGELAKRCNRTGRNNKYTFFLFSDVLIYAHRSGEMYKIHGELPLHLMKIMDLNSSKQKKSFHLIHPRKSFVISAYNRESKSTWLATINAAIGREVKRKARIEGARQNSAAFDR